MDGSTTKDPTRMNEEGVSFFLNLVGYNSMGRQGHIFLVKGVFIKENLYLPSFLLFLLKL